MEQEKDTSIGSLFEKAGDYLETRMDLVKLKATQSTSDIISSLVSKGIILLFIIFFMVLVNVGLALVIGEAIGKTYYGFFIMAAFYGIVGWVFHLFRRKWIKTPISNKIIQKMTRL